METKKIKLTEIVLAEGETREALFSFEYVDYNCESVPPEIISEFKPSSLHYARSYSVSRNPHLVKDVERVSHIVSYHVEA